VFLGYRADGGKGGGLLESSGSAGDLGLIDIKRERFGRYLPPLPDGGREKEKGRVHPYLRLPTREKTGHPFKPYFLGQKEKKTPLP